MLDMCLVFTIYIFLSPAKGRGREILKPPPSVCLSVHSYGSYIVRLLYVYSTN